jgi:GNAT superfamily N-acetyltransferase
MHSDHYLVDGDGGTVSDVLDDMVEVYSEVYAEPPYNSGSLWQRDAFLDRTRRQVARAGFHIIHTRSQDGEIIGYSFGVPFEQGRWWSSNASDPPVEILSATKFAVIELILRKPWRGRGIGRQMHDRLLKDRPEQYAILTAHPMAPARRMYQRWGWRQVGTAQHSVDSPVFDALVLPLPLASDPL